MSVTPDIGIVVFDWGGVILRIVRSFEEACARAGIPVRGDVVSQEAKERRKQVQHQFQVGLISPREFFDGVAASTMGAYTAAEFEAIHHAWLIEEYAGVGKLVDDIHAARKATTGLLSNTNEGHWLRHVPTRERRADFPTVGKLRHKHASHLMGLAKPHAEIHRAFEKASGFSPHEILFFDDLEENIATARACGWNTLQIDYTGDTAQQMRVHLRSCGVL